MRDENCIFCKIVEGSIPSATVYEDENFKAILDVNPAVRGHVIILSKNHAANLFELPDEDASKVMLVAKKVATALKKTYNCDGVNVLQNNGRAAGQTVFHLHVHVIPRFEGDTASVRMGWQPLDTPEDLAAIAEEIKANL